LLGRGGDASLAMTHSKNPTVSPPDLRYRNTADTPSRQGSRDSPDSVLQHGAEGPFPFNLNLAIDGDPNGLGDADSCSGIGYETAVRNVRVGRSLLSGEDKRSASQCQENKEGSSCHLAFVAV